MQKKVLAKSYILNPYWLMPIVPRFVSIILVSSLVYELTGFACADAIGAAGLTYFSISEGTEAFEKAKGKACNC
jgi:hypothetical protein